MPTPTVRIQSFVSASNAYGKAAVERANANGNPFLTRKEAEALPADLQDNYERFRRGSSPVGVRSFVEHHAREAGRETARADLNGDGRINLQELRLLPAHLQDNVANFGRLRLPAAPGPVDDISLPLKQGTIDAVRSALTDYVETKLTVRRRGPDDEYEYDSGDWAKLVHELGGDRAHDSLKAEMLELARSWRPDLPDWEANEWSGTLELTGHFHFMRLFVQLDEGRPPSFVTEID